MAVVIVEVWDSSGRIYIFPNSKPRLAARGSWINE